MKIFLFICAIFLLSSFGAKAQEQQFFETLYDVPVMEGLTELPDMSLSFDKPTGRIAEAGALIENLSDREVLSFYKNALEQMGWVQKEGVFDPYIFMRKDEKLSIFLEKSKVSRYIRFLIEPQ